MWRPTKGKWAGQRGLRPPASDWEADEKLDELEYPTSDAPLEVRLQLVQDLDRVTTLPPEKHNHGLVWLEDEIAVFEPKPEDAEADEPGAITH